MFFIIILLETAVGAHMSGFIYTNSFEATAGYRQYNSETNYKYDIPYYPTAGWWNVQKSNDSVRFRMGVSGDKSAYIRLAPTIRPFQDTTMHEIVISFGNENLTYLQRYVRSAPNALNSLKFFKKISTKGWISVFEPLMFTVEVFNNGRVMVTRDSERNPFIDETDPGVSVEYVGFVNWEAADKAAYFLECPLKW